MGYDGKGLSVGQMDDGLLEQGATDAINRLTGAYLIEAHGVEQVPSRHLSTVLVTTQAVGIVEVEGMEHLVHNLLCAPRLSHIVVEVGNVVARFVAVSILTNQARDIGRYEVTLQGRVSSKEGVEL